MRESQSPLLGATPDRPHPMKTSLRLAALAALAVSLSGASLAADESAAILARLKQLYPTRTFTSVAPAQVKGLYEVVMGRKIAYTDRTGRYFMLGSLVDMTTNDDLTAARQEVLSLIDVRKLPLHDAIVRVNGKGRRTLFVFSDPDCPYCQRLEPELDKLDDVTIYIFLFPIESLHSDAARKAQSIWCQADEKGRAQLWHRVVTHVETIATTECDNPLRRNLALGESLGVVGTPTIVGADGRSLPGMAPAAAIEEWLAQAKKVSLAPTAN